LLEFLEPDPRALPVNLGQVSGTAVTIALLTLLWSRHPISATRRTNLQNMVLILLSLILAALAVAISMIHTSFGILANSRVAREDTVMAKERSEQPTATIPNL
jgi:nitrate reductase gamma subunit